MRAADPMIQPKEGAWGYHGRSWVSWKDAVVAGRGLPVTLRKRSGTKTQLSHQID